MSYPKTIEPEMLFSVGAVEEELERIFHDPHFTESAILRKFLKFIVQETIHGRSNRLKEYTIALNVLEKPMSFNPQENCIVRIHAGRLRRALSQYYNELGRADQIVITIPKGKYVPVFANRMTNISSEVASSLDNSNCHDISVAVLPFLKTKDTQVKTFTDGLCMQLGSMLMRMDHTRVIAYQAIRNLVEAQPDFKDLAISVGLDHVITGGVQNMKNKIRVSIQMIECISYRQVWSETFERTLSRTNHFDIQDEICQYIIGQLRADRKATSYELRAASAL